VLGVQVDLILGAVQPEPDRAFGLAAIEVVDEQGLYLTLSFHLGLGPVQRG
jgi:hypothetical protein